LGRGKEKKSFPKGLDVNLGKEGGGGKRGGRLSRSRIAGLFAARKRDKKKRWLKGKKGDERGCL